MMAGMHLLKVVDSLVAIQVDKVAGNHLEAAVAFRFLGLERLAFADRRQVIGIGLKGAAGISRLVAGLGLDCNCNCSRMVSSFSI